MDDKIAPLVAQAADRIRRAQRVCCMTGAGVSAESGVPTFRGFGGLWEGRRPETLATPEAFSEDYARVWRFYQWRRKTLAECKPNPGHFALARLEEIVPDFSLITQNVDGLHHEAGSRRIYCLHGDIWIDRCTRCRYEARAGRDDFETIPHCQECGELARPGVVWFGEILPPEVFEAAQEASAQCEVMMVVGTSSVVQPAASLAGWARSNGACVIEINPEATPLTGSADLALAGPSGEVLPAIVEHLV
jgi:NAD-dependent deacetylase